MKVMGTSNFEYEDGELSEAILDIEERHNLRKEEKNDTEFLNSILEVMLDSYINKFDARRVQIMAHFKVMMMHFKEDIKYAEDEKNIKRAIERYDKSLKKQIKVTDNDLTLVSLMTDVEEIVKEFYETRNMVDKLYDMVMEKRYYFKAKILENRNKVCNHIDEEFSKLLETEKGKEFKDYIIKAHNLCKSELLDDKRFNHI